MPGSQASMPETLVQEVCLNPRIVIVVVAALMLGSIAAGQNQPGTKPQAPAVPPGSDLASTLARRLSDDLHVKTVVGEPIKAGSVTLIPILMIDVSFGGGGMAAPGWSGWIPKSIRGRRWVRYERRSPAPRICRDRQERDALHKRRPTPREVRRPS